MPAASKVLVAIATDGDDNELEMLGIELAEELSLLPVSSVAPVRSDEVPAGARGSDAAAVGKLVVEVIPEFAKAVIDTVRSWLQRSVARSVEVTIDGDGATPEQGNS